MNETAEAERLATIRELLLSVRVPVSGAGLLYADDDGTMPLWDESDRDFQAVLATLETSDLLSVAAERDARIATGIEILTREGVWLQREHAAVKALSGQDPAPEFGPRFDPIRSAEWERLVAENEALQARIEAVVVRCRAALAVKVADSDAGDAACAALAAVILREDLELDIRSAPAGDQPEATPEPPHLDPKPWVCTAPDFERYARADDYEGPHLVIFDPLPADENGKAYSDKREDYPAYG